VEIDGEHHALLREADSRRTDIMEQAGWRVIRFGASEAVQNPEGVWAEIARVLGIEA
jgi:very-short-patch-repair endonuclease